MSKFASKFDSHVTRFRKALTVTQPTAEQIASAVASIDAGAETAVISDIIDHHTQLESWMSIDTDTVLEQSILTVGDALESTETGSGVDFSTLPVLPQPESTDAAPGASQTAIEELSELIDDVEQMESVDSDDVTIDDIIAVQDPNAIDRTVYDISAQLTNRETFESAKSETTGTDNIQRTLKKVRTQMVTKRVAGLLLATNIDPAFINREIHTGSKYNVYALGKLADLMFGITGGAVSNAINIAIVKSLFALRETDIVFTGEVARACCSRQWKIDGRTGSKLHRHTVSTSTAPTQASSTMSALATLGVVKVEGTAKFPTYTLTESPLTKKLEAIFA